MDSETVKRALLPFSVVTVLLFFFVITELVGNYFVWFCFEKETEITPIISEGCGNLVCDLSEFQDYNVLGKTVCIDCLLIPHCWVIDYNSDNGFNLVDFNGSKAWTKNVFNYCKIDLNTIDDSFKVGETEYEWDGNFSRISFDSNKQYRCKRLRELFK